ncbi:MAG: tyrosine-type recombinase/integrase [Flavobacteriia bacterium]|nr:tyrosine-type recombinase/integrase [Flavobacteriia bacterium]
MTPFFVIEKFINYLETEKRFSEHTVIAYKKDIEQFLEFTEIEKEENITEITVSIIRAWIVKLFDLHISKKSINRKLSTLRTFFKWLMKEGLISTNPTSKLQGVKAEKRLPSFAKISEMNKEVGSEIFNDDYDGIRNRLIVEVFYQTGIRLSELITLNEKNISKETIKVIGKRKKERIIPISENLFSLIVTYNDLKKSMVLYGETFFLLKNGNKMYPKLVYRIINNYLGYVTNLDKCSPHVLRHTFATHMLNNGAGLETLKDLLGHANLSATQIYTHNSFTQLTNIYSQAHPRGHKKK